MTHVQAHRGLSGEFPENTLAAFKGAVDAGFDGIELDIRLTHDHEVVVLHDANLARTTDGVGRVSDLDYKEIATYDTGAGPVPRLADCLDELRDWTGHWNIEIKDRAAAKAAAELVLARAFLTGRVSFSAMDPDVLEELRADAPDVPRELITLGPPDDDDLAIVRELRCRGINVDHEFIDEALVAKAKDAGVRLAAWTVNDADEARRVTALGVDTVITDMRAVLDAVGG